MTDSDRKRAEELKADLDRQAVCEGGQAVSQDKFGLIAKLLLTYPVPNASAEAGKARGEAYIEALHDVPFGVLAEAIRRWNRGEVGDHDYRWAPAPAVLRLVCQKITDPLRDAIADLNSLLKAVSIERAMDPEPIREDSKGVPTLRRMA